MSGFKTIFATPISEAANAWIPCLAKTADAAIPEQNRANSAATAAHGNGGLTAIRTAKYLSARPATEPPSPMRIVFES